MVTGSQLSLFYNVDPLTGDVTTIPAITRDLISQEPLDQALQRGPTRHCAECLGHSAIPIGGGEGAVKRWLERWTEECWCGGTWISP